jgi:hypothetical protein
MAKYRIAWLPGDGIGQDVLEGDELQFTSAAVVNLTTAKTFPILPLPKSRQVIIDAGGLISYTRSRLLNQESKQLC